MPTEEPSAAPGETRTVGPPSPWVGRSWALAGPVAGLVGGMMVGLGEPVLRLWSDRGLMTTRLWLEVLSFSLVSHVAVWVTVCTVVCVLGGLIARRRPGVRARIQPGPLACAAFVVGLGVMVSWGHLAGRGVSLARGAVGLTAAFAVGVGILLPAAWICTRLRPTVLGRSAAGVAGIAVWLAAALMIASLGLQWQGRSRVRSAEGFWPPKFARPASRSAGRPPDVVLVVFDTLRADRLGCYGYPRPTSPHIDAFAADAVQFQRSVSPGVWTEPAHASIFTGLYRSQHGVGWNRIWLDDRFVTLAEILRDCGYQTIALSNNPHVSPGTNLTQGFEWYGEPIALSYATRDSVYAFAKYVWAGGGPLGSPLGRWFVADAGGHVTTFLVRERLRRRDRTRPFLLFINYMEPHGPYEPTRAYRRAFVQPEDLARSYQIDQSLEANFLYCLARKSVYSRRDLKILSDLYDGRIRELDDHFADLMHVLGAEVNLDDTLIILTADHGENLGDHELIGHDFCIYDTLVHVPLLIRWPRVLSPQRVDRLVQTSDLFPSVLGWVGAEARQSAKVMARPLGEALQATPQSVYRNAFSEYLYPPRWAFDVVRRRDPTFDPSRWMLAFRAVFDQRWKLIIRSDQRNELYDLSSDPGEEKNLIGTRRRELARLERQLAKWRASFKPFDPNQFTGPSGHRLTDDQVRRLRDLGYVQ